MSVRIQRLAASEPDRAPQRALTRKIERHSADRSVVIQSSAGEQSAARLRDLSIYGCNLNYTSDWLRMGRFITIRVGADRTIQAIVRWSRDGATGVEFLRPISAAEIDTLGRPG